MAEPILLDAYRRAPQTERGELGNKGRGPLQPPPGGGNSGDMEARVAALEAHVAHIREDVADLKSDVKALRGTTQTDFRVLFGAIIAVALGLAGLMAKGFHWL